MYKNRTTILILFLILFYQCTSTKLQNFKISDEQIINDLNFIISNKSQYKNVGNFNQAVYETINRFNIKLIDSIVPQQVILVDGFTGCSFNCCSGKLILIYNIVNGSLINVYQFSNQIEFVDLNNDSIMEIYTKTCRMWMGEYGENHKVFSLNFEKSIFNQYNSSPKSFGEKSIQLKENNEYLFYESELKFKDINNDNIKDIIVVSSYQNWDSNIILNKTDTIITKPF